MIGEAVMELEYLQLINTTAPQRDHALAKLDEYIVEIEKLIAEN